MGHKIVEHTKSLKITIHQNRIFVSRKKAHVIPAEILFDKHGLRRRHFLARDFNYKGRWVCYVDTKGIKANTVSVRVLSGARMESDWIECVSL